MARPQKSVMTHQFSQVPAAEIPRASFDRSHGHKTTFDMDRVIPVFVDEALPGDTFSLNMHAFARLATPLHPFMDNISLDSFFFAVPMRLVWDNWQKFNGEQDSPEDSTDFIIPQLVMEHIPDSVGDHFGIPTGHEISTSALPFRAYQLIYNEWFRDQNLQTPFDIDHGDGPDDPASAEQTFTRQKRHDYFTSALPWPQKGDSVTLPLGTEAPVRANADEGQNLRIWGNDSLFHRMASDGPHLAMGEETVNPSDNFMFTDLSEATAATINELRQAFQIQKLYERDARGGTRYTEIIRAHFGVTSPDARLQRPEYLGGGSTPISVNAVAQTSETSAESPQGNLAATGTVNISGHGFTKSFTEHCIILGLVSARADLTYQQGLNRMWSRKTRWDFYWPALAHIGEQTILNKEIFSDGTAEDDDVWAYQERFAEYRYKPSTITGHFRSNLPDSLDTWHLSEDFNNLPLFNANFVRSNTPIDRVIAVPTEPHFIFDSYMALRCARPMPLYGVPGLIDHF